MRRRLIRSKFSRQIPTGARTGDSRRKEGEREAVGSAALWKRLVPDWAELSRFADSIDYNPIERAHVDRGVRWPFPSFHRSLRPGSVAAEWGCTDEFAGDFDKWR